MAVVVTHPGLLTTVQDLGRGGWRCWGVPASGPLDAFAFRQANLLVGNSVDQAGLEITLRGPTLRFELERMIAVCGAPLSAEIGGRPVPMSRPLIVSSGSELKLGTISHGCRAYLAVAGGIDVPRVLDSRSTHPTLRIGGHEGRALRTGDRLPCGVPSPEAQRLARWLAHQLSVNGSWAAAPWGASAGSGTHPTTTDDVATTIRVFPGRQRSWFSDRDWEQLVSTEYEVNPQSNRVGLRLNGARLGGETGPHEHFLEKGRRELLSEGLAPGAVQVPHHGHPIIILADGPPTGGYPKIAQVYTVDLCRLGQVPPGGRVRFESGCHAEACREWDRRETYFLQLQLGLAQRLATLPGADA